MNAQQVPNPALPNLSGEWIGYYTGHFDEVIRIEQQGEQVQAIKVTGDDYVPEGTLTWRANLATGEGQGQIAERGFRNPRLVPGKLILLGQEKIRFVWENFGVVEFRRDD